MSTTGTLTTMTTASPTRWLNEAESRAWRHYQQMSSRLTAQLNRSLIQETGLSLSDYEVLVVLSESPEDALRAFELGACLQWEKSRLSHHLTRMEKRGLVKRQTCASDGRGLFIALTPTGRRTIEAAAPHHLDDVRQMMIDLLTPTELEVLAEIATKVLAVLPVDDEARYEL